MYIHLLNEYTVEADVNCLVLPVFEETLNELQNNPFLVNDDKHTLQILIDRKVITAKAKDSYYLPTPLSPYESILVLGLGEQQKCNNNILRQCTGKVVPYFSQHKKTHLLLDLAAQENLNPEPFIEALTLADYSFDQFKTDKKEEKTHISDLAIHVATETDLTLTQVKCDMAYIKCKNANWARDLGNLPGNHLTPSILADKAVEFASKHDNVAIKVLNEEEMAAENMNVLLAVSSGSEEEAKLITLHYTHPNAKQTVALVGKGLTFDAGGICIKDGKGMDGMINDMCGAAAVLGAFKTICEIEPQINVVCVVPSSENLIDGKSMRPGDILTASNGVTVEVTHTDAEGRLILCDALAYTCKHFKPAKIVDAATLTGAVVTALASTRAGIISEDQDLIDKLMAAGDKVHEKLWPLPLDQSYKDMMKGKQADLRNVNYNGAGSITGGAFLSNFVTDCEWAHLDIAGVANKLDDATYLQDDLATGFGSRLLTRWILNEVE